MKATYGFPRSWVSWLTMLATGTAVFLALGVAAWAQGGDTTPPLPPLDVFVEQGGSWQATNKFDVWWENPVEQQTPVVAAHYELCPAVPLGPCTVHEVIGPDVSAATIAVPHIGWFWLQIWLEDSAGNVNSDMKSDPVMLRFDGAAPGAGRLQAPNGWLNAVTSDSPTLILETESDGIPLSGIRGYSITLDGSAPDATVEEFAAQDNDRYRATHELGAVNEGTTEVRLRSISNAGVASTDVGIGHLRVDWTAPSVAVKGLPTIDTWARQPITASITADDQTGLSGMSPADASDPVNLGGYLDFQIGGQAPDTVRGNTTEIVFSEDGEHSLSVRATDLAGNTSSLTTRGFKIDQTSPTGAFRPLSASDPRQLIVDVADGTSGIASGRIEFRKVGEAAFKRLATMRDGEQLKARIDDDGISAGAYEYRAVVRDVAGNMAVVDRMVNGKPMALWLPVRVGSSVEATLRTRQMRCTPKRSVKVKAKRRAKAKRKPRCAARDLPVRSSLPFGSALTVAGRLTTVAGVPIGGATVVLETQLASGGAFTQAGSARTDKEGRFATKVPGGASRTVRFRYQGTNTVRPSTATRSTTVKAAARLRVNRRRLRNGQAVVFKGALLGRPIPLAGKLVALQAKVGRRWRTFATPRAKRDGTFRHRYRFTSTTGVRRYAFRALVTREAAYPYERGTSKTVRVVVSGGRSR